MKPSEGLESEEDRNVSNMRILYQSISFVNTKILGDSPKFDDATNSTKVCHTTHYSPFMGCNFGGNWKH